MHETGPSGLQVASVWRRLGAGLIDTVVLGVPVVAVSGGAAALYMWWGRRRGRDLGDMPSFTPRGRWNVVILTASAAARVPTRNWRSPGYRALRLRRVGVHTGGPLSARNVLVEQAVAAASGELRRRVMKPWLTRNMRRLEGFQPEMREIQRAHAADREAQQRALKEFYKRKRVHPARSCVPPLVGTAVMQAPVLWSPLNQTIPQRFAGIVVVQD
jgi:60Kd inner membrane protein/RDD family